MSRIIFATFIIAATALTSLPAQALEKLVTVTGEASLPVEPDTAVIRLGVWTQGKTAREASDQNAPIMTRVVHSLKEGGVAERDIQTSHLSLEPQYGGGSLMSSDSGGRLAGFQASNKVTVKVREIAKIADVLDRATGAGANEISGIDFVVLEQTKLLDKAREDAIANARRTASLYAQAAGAKLGRVISITEQGAVFPVDMRTIRSGYSSSKSVYSSSTTTVIPGEQTLRVNVNVSYELVQ